MRLRSFSDLNLFGRTANAAGIKNGAPTEAGRREDEAMLDVAETCAFENPPTRFEERDPPKSAYQQLKQRMVTVGRSRGGLQSFVMTISPETARSILEHHNCDNRPLREGRVDEFVKVIAEGRWRLTSQGLSFARDGRLNNGQHRLRAIAAGKHAVEIYITIGEERDVFDVLDTGAVRGGSDTLAIRGYANSALLASSARFLAIIDGNHIYNPPRFANDVLGEIVVANPSLVEGVLIGMSLGKKFRCSGTALSVAAYKIKAFSKSVDRFDAFIERVRTGLGAETQKDPILLLRDGLQTQMVDKHLRSGSHKTMAQYASFVAAWNLYLRKRKGLFRWDPTQPLPTVE